jgi:hypothetical protein
VEEGAPRVLRALKMVVEAVELEEHEGFQRHSWQPARLLTLRLLEVHWEVMVALREEEEEAALALVLVVV